MMANTHHPRGGPLPDADVLWARNRPDGVPRPPLPAVGDVVGFRAVPSGRVVAARVHEVESLTDPWAHEHAAFEPHGPDVAVWDVVTDERRAAIADPDRPGSYLFQLRDDPWPSVVLCIEPVAGKGPRTYTVTKEARLPGSAGWTTPDQIGR